MNQINVKFTLKNNYYFIFYIDERLQLQKEMIFNDFDPDHYLFDLFENDEIKPLINSKIEFYEKINNDPLKLFDDDEFQLLSKLKKREFLQIDNDYIIKQIIDIIYSFCYEFRIMDGDLSCESGSTINKLSSVLNCFTIEENIFLIIKNNFERSITYPLIRNFDFALKVSINNINII